MYFKGNNKHMCKVVCIILFSTMCAKMDDVILVFKQRHTFFKKKWHQRDACARQRRYTDGVEMVSHYLMILPTVSTFQSTPLHAQNNVDYNGPTCKSAVGISQSLTTHTCSSCSCTCMWICQEIGNAAL